MTNAINILAVTVGLIFINYTPSVRIGENRERIESLEQKEIQKIKDICIHKEEKIDE